MALVYCPGPDRSPGRTARNVQTARCHAGRSQGQPLRIRLAAEGCDLVV